MSLDIFQQLLRVTKFCMAVHSIQLWSLAIFEHKQFHKVV